MRHTFYLVVDICAVILDMVFSFLLLPILAICLCVYLLAFVVTSPFRLKDWIGGKLANRKHRRRCEAQEQAKRREEILMACTRSGYRSCYPDAIALVYQDEDELGPFR
jgi:hypothetical protein